MDLARHLEHRRILFNLAHRGPLNGSALRDSTEIVTGHVDDHDILGTIFEGFPELLSEREILFECAASRTRSFHRTTDKLRAVFREEELWRRARDREFLTVNEAAIAAPLGLDHLCEELKGIR